MRLSKNVMLKLYDNLDWLASLTGFIGWLPCRGQTLLTEAVSPEHESDGRWLLILFCLMLQGGN